MLKWHFLCSSICVIWGNKCCVEYPNNISDNSISQMLWLMSFQRTSLHISFVWVSALIRTISDVFHLMLTVPTIVKCEQLWPDDNDDCMQLIAYDLLNSYFIGNAQVTFTGSSVYDIWHNKCCAEYPNNISDNSTPQMLWSQIILMSF